jgi:hypothetical protein
LLKRSLFTLTVCAGLNLARPALAESAPDQRETARVVFNQGLEYADAGRWQEAAERFRSAYAVKPTAEIAYNLAQAYIRLGYLAGGAELLERAANDPEATAPVKEAARVRLAQVTPRLGRLTVQLDGTPGTHAYLDGRLLEPSSIGVTLPVDPGPHLVQARWQSGVDLSRRITVAEGRTDTVLLAAPAPARPTGAPIYKRGWFWVAVAGVAAGTAVAVAAARGHGPGVTGNVGTWQVQP